jgi:hypothetical protein
LRLIEDFLTWGKLFTNLYKQPVVSSCRVQMCHEGGPCLHHLAVQGAWGQAMLRPHTFRCCWDKTRTGAGSWCWALTMRAGWRAAGWGSPFAETAAACLYIAGSSRNAQPSQSLTPSCTPWHEAKATKETREQCQECTGLKNVASQEDAAPNFCSTRMCNSS